MSDEITKPIEEAERGEVVGAEPVVEAVTDVGVGAEPTGEVSESSVAPITPEVSSDPVSSPAEPMLEAESSPTLESTTIITEPIPEPVLTPNTTNQESIPVGVEAVGTELANEVLKPQTKQQEPSPVGDGAVGAEPAGEVQRPYSLDPKLNKMIEGFVRGMNRAKENLILARASTKAKMMKKVYKIMDLFKKQSPASAKSSVEARKITNDDVEKFLHTDDTTATRYLNILTKEGKIKREGSPHTSHYTKVE